MANETSVALVRKAEDTGTVWHGYRSGSAGQSNHDDKEMKCAIKILLNHQFVNESSMFFDKDSRLFFKTYTN